VFNPCNQYPTFSNLRYAVGFGFRWNSPIGPLRFEWGIPLNRQVGEDPIVFEFTIGNFF
jgi:outer membrane protein insertion porin family